MAMVGVPVRRTVALRLRPDTRTVAPPSAKMSVFSKLPRAVIAANLQESLRGLEVLGFATQVSNTLASTESDLIDLQG